jgi:hypothetical protein
MAIDWLLCCYRLPREPTRLRLAVWRRLRRIGAVMLHDGLWTLPADAKTREDFEWLAEEIEERSGQVLLWESRSVDPAQDAVVIERFRAEADARYAAIADTAEQLGRLARRRSRKATQEQVMQRLRVLERSLRLDQKRDYFRAKGRAAALAAVRAAVSVAQPAAETPIGRRKQRAVGD